MNKAGSVDSVVIHLLLHPPATVPLPSSGHMIVCESNDNPLGRGICLPTEGRRMRGSERPSSWAVAESGVDLGKLLLVSRAFLCPGSGRKDELLTGRSLCLFLNPVAASKGDGLCQSR